MTCLPNDFCVGDVIEPQLESSRRPDGWTAARQRAFCEAVATGATVEGAARSVGLSASSAYAFRNSAKGSAFAIGWQGAQLLQRQRLADLVVSRAFKGQTVTVTRPDGTSVQRHHYDNRLAMAVLTRLDRIAAGQGANGHADLDAGNRAARLAAAEFDRYLDLLGDGASPARAGLFLAARAGKDASSPGTPEFAALAGLARADLYDRTGAGTLAEVDVHDLDPAGRAGWTAEQWARAEAAGLLVLAGPSGDATNADGSSPDSQHWPEEGEERDGPVWFSDADECWYTSFPPPLGFYGPHWGTLGTADYYRALSPDEQAVMTAGDTVDVDALARERDRWFAAHAAGDDPDGGTPDDDEGDHDEGDGDEGEGDDAPARPDMPVIAAAHAAPGGVRVAVFPDPPAPWREQPAPAARLAGLTFIGETPWT